MSVTYLEPHIRQILSAPGTDLRTISAKRVRKQLLELDPSTSEDFIRTNKAQIDQLIASVFERVTDTAAAGYSAPESPAPPAKRKREDEEDEEAGEGEGDDDDDGDGAASPPPKSKASKSKLKKGGLTDEEYARRLSTEINGRSARASRSGKANGKPKKATNKSPKKTKKSAERVESEDESGDGSDSGKKRKKKSSGGAKGGFGKEFVLSESLSAVLDTDKMSRPQVVKALWGYIKGHDLQNPSNKREILCDDRLRAVFNADKIDMFKMNKVLGQHLHEDE